MRKKVMTILMVILGLLISSQLMAQEAKKIYRIQVFAAKDKASADNFASQLTTQGYNPVTIRQKGDWWKVMIGEFGTYADTLYFKNAMRKGSFPDAFISKDYSSGTPIMSLSAQELKTEPLFKDAIKRQWKPVTTNLLAGTEMATVQYRRPEVSPEILSADNNTLTEQNLFNKAFSYSGKAEVANAKSALNTFLQRFPASDKVPRVKLHLAYWTFKDSTDAEAEQKFREVKQSYSNREEAGEAALRMGYIKLKNKDKDSALREFEEVARGTTKASDEARLEAMFRCAKMYHASRERVKALQAYRECAEITDRTAFDPNIHVEIAGLYMELARSGAGSLDDCIHECDRIVNSTDVASKTIATAKQMKVECVYLKKDYTSSISLAEHILANHPEERKVCMLAQFYLALSLYKKGNLDKASDTFNGVINKYTDNDNLPHNNLRAASYLHLSQVALEQSKRDEAKLYLKTLLSQYPDSKYTSEAEKYANKYFSEPDRNDILGR